MNTPTRRGLIGGAIATAATPALARAERATRSRRFAAKAKVVRRGRAIAVAPRSGRIVVAHDRLRTITVVGGGRKRVLDVGGQPLEIATSPDGRLAAVTTAAWDEPGLAIVDLKRAKLVRRLEAGGAPFGVAFTDRGDRILVAGGEEEGEVTVFDADDSFRRKARTRVGDCPRAVVAVPGTDDAWIVLEGPDRVVLLDGRKGRVKRKIKTPPLPDRLAVSPDGKRLLVSHGGRESDRVSLIDVKTEKVRRLKAGRLPSGVAFSRSGRAAVALGGAGRIVVIGSGGKRARHDVGGSPRGLVVAGRRAWTVDALTGKVARVRL